MKKNCILVRVTEPQWVENEALAASAWRHFLSLIRCSTHGWRRFVSCLLLSLYRKHCLRWPSSLAACHFTANLTPSIWYWCTHVTNICTCAFCYNGARRKPLWSAFSKQALLAKSILLHPSFGKNSLASVARVYVCFKVA